MQQEKISCSDITLFWRNSTNFLWDFNLQKSSSEFKLTLAKFSIPALSGKFCRVTKTQDLTMMTQQHERHFKPRISKEVSLTLRLLERKKRVPTRVCSDELVKIFKAYYQIYICRRGSSTKVCVLHKNICISQFTRTRIRKSQLNFPLIWSWEMKSSCSTNVNCKL